MFDIIGMISYCPEKLLETHHRRRKDTMRKKRYDCALSQAYIKKALVLLIKNKSDLDVSVSDICVKAGVSRTTFYKHFADVNDVYDQMIIEALDNYIADIRQMGLTIEKAEQMYEIWFSHLLRHYDILKLFADAGRLDFMSKLYILARDRIVVLFTHVSRNDFFSQIKYSAITAGLYQISVEWIKNGAKEPPEVMASYASKTLTNDYVVF